MPIVVGVDLGTTKITSLAMDASTGDVLTVATAANDANSTSEPDRQRARSEWNADRITDQGLACLKQVVSQLGARAGQIAGIGITGQQHGVVLVGSDGRPASPLINWQDRRLLDPMPTGGRTWLEEVRSRLGDDIWQQTGCRIQPGFMAGTLFWLKANGQLPSGCRSLFIMDHFGALLTSRPAVTEPSCAGSSGVFHVGTRQWDAQAIAALGLSMDLFPDVREASQQIGTITQSIAHVTGLPAGVPVFAPIGDHQASFAGSVSDRATSLLINVGTGAQVAAFTDSLEFTPPIELRPFPCGGNLLSNVGLAGGWSYQVLEQFFRDVGITMFGSKTADPLYPVMNSLAASVPAGAEGLTCEPLFAGTRLDPTIRGTLAGLSPQNFTARHLARAVLEGMARSLLDGYHAIRAITGSKSRLIAAGNGLRENPLLAEIVSQAFGMPIEFTPHREEAAYGAARIAARQL